MFTRQFLLILVCCLVMCQAPISALSTEVPKPDPLELKRFSDALALVRKNYVVKVEDAKLLELATQGMLQAVKASDALRDKVDSLPFHSGPREDQLGQSDDKAMQRFVDAWSLIKKQHSVSDKLIADGAVNGMVGSLHPASSYLNAESVKALKMEMGGNFAGVGMELTVKDGTLTVVSPQENSPAWLAGIEPGDRITSINGESTNQINLGKAVSTLRGPIGSTVKVSVMRNGWTAPKEITITRQKIELPPVKKGLLQDGYVWARIVKFSEGTDKKLAATIDGLGGNNGIKGIILDLRNCPGGLVDQAIKVVNLFINKGLIMYTEGRAKDQLKEFRASDNKNVYTFQVAVLINGKSSGSAEIVAGALKDHDRALILGDKSFGQGILQTVFPMADGSALRLATAKYYTPKGAYMGNGIQPDVQIEPTAKPENKRPTDEASFAQDEAVQKALEWLKSAS